VLACVTEAQFRNLCNDVIDRPDLFADERFARNPARLANVIELRRILNEIFGRSPREHWIERIRAAGVPSGAVATVAEALSSELVAARSAVQEVVHTGVGPYPALRTPARLHDTAPVPPCGAPQLGEHTRAVLSEMGGLSDQEIKALIVAGAARQAP
jgi:crotonobetainyl-CoA:carnitine CoA-transferase CaiB-like acyl-CoA transferase